MAKPKPTRVVTPRIVQPGESSGRPWLWLLFLVALGIWTWQVFEFGRQEGGLDVGDRDRAENMLRERIVALEEERDVLRQAAARFERAGQIDRAAADGVQSEVKALQDERAELKREVAFLKTLVSGGGGKKLLLDGHSLTANGEGAFHFEVTLTKQGDDAETVTGQVEVSLIGEQDGAEKTLDMATITDGKRTNIGIKFKNFQKLKTEVMVPEEFQPRALEVSVTPDGKTFGRFEQRFDWKVSGS